MIFFTFFWSGLVDSVTSELLFVIVRSVDVRSEGGAVLSVGGEDRVAKGIADIVGGSTPAILATLRMTE